MMPDPRQEEIKKLKKKLKHQEQKNTEIRDQMAIQRTIFASERTLMAYLRTAIAVIAGGFAAVKLSHLLYMEVIGVVMMVLGLLLAIYSYFRYLRKQRFIKRQQDEYVQTSQHHARLHEKEISGYGNID